MRRYNAVLTTEHCVVRRQCHVWKRCGPQSHFCMGHGLLLQSLRGPALCREHIKSDT